jgi:hypothetical protein
MTTGWTTAVAAAADTLGEMLMAIAEGRGEPAYEQMAAAALRTGLAVLLQAPPAPDRLEQVGLVLWRKLHDGDNASWASLTPIEKAFWLDLATAAAAAADAGLLDEAGVAEH